MTCKTKMIAVTCYLHT